VLQITLVAELLKEFIGKFGIEIVAFNGEDHYSVGGQMDYLNRYQDGLNQILVAINVDDVGYFKGNTAYSFYECPAGIRQKAKTAFKKSEGLLEGDPWYQGDHMIFAQNKVPTIAVTSDKVQELMAAITHSCRDTPEIIDCGKLVKVAYAIESLTRAF
jgi:aminopeptidase YwaD